MQSGTIIRHGGRTYTVVYVVERQMSKYSPPSGSLVCVSTDEHGTLVRENCAGGRAIVGVTIYPDEIQRLTTVVGQLP